VTERGTGGRIDKLFLSAFFAMLAVTAGACTPAYPPAPGGRIAAAAPPYIIGPEDMIDVFVYRAPELSVHTPVRPDGRISTPLSPDVTAVGRTPSQLARAIEAKLAKYVKEPNVTVMVNGFHGPPDRTIRVVGEVNRVLSIPYQADMTVLDVIIASNGLTRFAAGNRAVLVRQGAQGPKTYGLRLDDLIRGGDIADNVALRPGDTIFVPQAWF
jgi:polysaccharide biosynthesis/export protein